MGLSEYLPLIAAAGAGHAKGKFNRQQLDREEMKEAFAMEAQKRQEGRANRQLDLEDKRLTQADQDRRDVLKFRIDDAGERAKDRDADRNARIAIAHEASLDRGEARSARKEARELRPDERETAADQFAFRMVTAANGDPRVAQDYGARDMATAKRLGLRRDHYYAAAQRYKDRFTAKAKATASDAELDGEAPAQAGRTPAPAAAAPPAALAPLTPADRAKAETDPGFKAYLTRKGYTL